MDLFSCESFRMTIEGVVTTPKVGDLACGRIKSGKISSNGTVEIKSPKTTLTGYVKGIEMFRKLFESRSRR